MRLVRLVVCLAIVALAAAQSHGQTVADSLLIQGVAAATWVDRDTSVIQVTGPVTIDLDRTHLTADRAVVWIRPSGGTVVDQQLVEISLLGNAFIKQNDITRSGGTLFVTANVKGAIRVTATERSAEDQSKTELYKSAQTIREANQRRATSDTAANANADRVNIAGPVVAPPVNAPPIPPPATDVRFRADQITPTYAADGTIAVTLGGNILLIQQKSTGERVEMQATRMVLFTKAKTPAEARNMAGQDLRDKIQSVYLEGDVRLDSTPADPAKSSVQRMTAERAYFELDTDRAILTDAVFHTVDPKTQMPVVMRADTLRQLATDKWKAEGVRLTTSTFANPSFAVAASSAYVTREETGDPLIGDRYKFAALNVRPQFWGLPVFFLPAAGGSITEHGFPLRNIGIGQSSRFGTSIETEWGLAETLGYAPTKDLDISYRADYYSDRGPAGGLNAKYSGGFITETTKQPWNFTGDMRSYFVDDHGVDKLGANRADVDPSEKLRGRVMWQHQHFLPDDWQIQARASYVSDANFLEEWFPREFEDGLPEDISFYAKRQRDSEALTLLVNYQPNHIITDAEFAQEQYELAHLPEIGYHRIGDSFADDSLTFFSDNTMSALKMQKSGSTLVQQGYRPDQLPGIPSSGQTGIADGITYRGDFRQEVDYPLSTGHFKVVPYVFGRMTDYSDSPAEGTQNRLYVGSGIRMSTAFWATDDTAESNLFDIHRVRHVIEPELNLYTSAQTTDRNSVFIYDEQTDDLQDVSAASIALNQRWQTKRGGPGKWRSVDFFTFNVVANFFANKPPDNELPPSDFRGLFFPSLPESSVPRDSLNADATWRVSDDMVLLGDVQYNVEENRLATAAVGLAVRHDERLSYTVGNSYINDLDSNITSVGLSYMISKKYTLGYYQSFDFGRDENVNFTTSLTRKFDTFAMLFRVSYDEITGESSMGFSLSPVGAGGSFGTDTAQAFSQRR